MNTKSVKQQQQYQRIDNTMRAFQLKWFGEFIIILCCWMVWYGLCGSTQVVPLNSFNHSTEVNQTRQPKCKHHTIIAKPPPSPENVQCKNGKYILLFEFVYSVTTTRRMTRNKQMKIKLSQKKLKQITNTCDEIFKLTTKPYT